ncbi:unnamed protein product [Didymodactylos carnosus]|uniref:Uncharacterized protein n=1 Tax=Didymodactylos carnosus TaxID=1234261 RepID=A0A813UHF8_9BILA|nr:unnamed protein product [Didymodactylos carnosus]CAF0827739.1 unnamed protein product [Didymodactylos carnosus]CAF3569944.1 unnamed protein product [Didymodactylos carnosus]CAF3614636.1 unnamed protein product [Didymodactylos carnosus]
MIDYGNIIKFIPNRSQTPIQDESNNASSNVVNSQLISNESKHPSSPPHLQQQAKKPHLRNNFKRTLRPSNSMSFRDGNTTVLARSSFNIRRAQYGAGTFNHGRTIINRNGEQYIEDMNERIDRRFVRSIDNNGVKRYYEVIDIIPTKTVRRYKQSHGQNTLKSTKYDQSERPVRINSFRQSVQSPLLDFTGMDNPQHINDEYHRYLQTFNETNNVTNLTSQEHSLLTNDSSSMNTADVSSNTSVPNDNYFRRRKPPKASVTSSSKTKMFYNNNIPPADINRKTSDSVSASSSQESKENKKSDRPVNNNQYVRSAQSDPRAIINNITYI